MRGTGSLRALLGQDTYKRRPPRGSSQPAGSTATEQRTQGASAPSASCDTSPVQIAGPEAGPSSAAAPATAAAAPTASPAPQGPASPASGARGVRCPVCSMQLPPDNTAINTHIGKSPGLASSRLNYSYRNRCALRYEHCRCCPRLPLLGPSPIADKCLSRGALQKQTKQASIFKFAVAKPPSQSPPQRRSPASAAAVALAAKAAAAAGEIIDMTGAADEAMQGSGSGGMAAAVSVATKAQTAGRSWQGPAAAAPAAPGVSDTSEQQQQQQLQQRGRQLNASQSLSISWSSDRSTRSQGEQEVEQQVPVRQAATGTPSQPQLQQPFQLQPALPTKLQAPAAPPGSLQCFPCAVVGRRFLKHDAPCQAGQVTDPLLSLGALLHAAAGTCCAAVLP